MISERTGAAVNAFAYISQIIHNSILFIINSKKKDLENLRKQMAMVADMHFPDNQDSSMVVWEDRSMDHEEHQPTEITETVYLREMEGSLVDELRKLESHIERCKRMDVHYPKDYRISFDEYNELKDLLKGKVSIVRSKE
jgi:hypothetical protein